MSVQQSLINQINDQKSQANNLVRDAQNFLSQAALSLRYSWQPGALDADYEVNAVYTPPRLEGTPPIRTPSPRSVRNFTGFLSPEEIVIDDWPEIDGNISTEDLFLHRAPTEAREFDESPPDIDLSLKMPDEPELTDIQMPALLDIRDPGRPVKPQLPDFETQTAVFRGAIPHELESMFWRIYRSLRDEMLAALDASASDFVRRYFPQHEELHRSVDEHLLSFMRGNITALPAQYQDQIYRRQQAQVDAQAERVKREAMQGAQRRGYYHPPGALQAAIRVAVAEAARNQGDAALGAASRTAELEMQFTQFAIQTISTARQQAIAAYDQQWRNTLAVNDLAIGTARSLCNLVLEIQDRWLELYQLDQFQTELDISVWDTRARYVMLDLEVHKQILEVERLRSQLNQDQIRLVEARIALDERLLRRYGLQLEALDKRLQLQEQRIRVFESQVRAYQGYVSGKEANASIFRSLMEGDRLKLEGRLSGLEVTRQQLGLIDTKVRAQDSVNRARSQYNQDRISVWRTEVEKVLADYQMERVAQDGDIAAARLIIEKNALKLREELQKFSTTSENDRTRLGMQREVLQIQNDRAMKFGQLLLDQAEKLAQLQKESAGVSANMAASLVAGFTTLLQASSVENIQG